MPHRRSPTTILAAFGLACTLLCGTAAAQGLPTGATSYAPERFRDVPEGHWASDAITRMSVLGILTGYPDGTFRGERQATRYELAVVSARLVDLIGGSLAELALDPQFWDDVERAAQTFERVRRLEEALDGAASLAYARELDARLLDIEEYLNSAVGEERFPQRVRSEDMPLVAGDTVPAASGGVGTAGGSVAPRPPGPFSGASYWLGVTVGYPLPGTVHVGVRDLYRDLGVRAGVGFDPDGRLGLELHARLALPTPDRLALEPYLAGGPFVTVGREQATGGIAALAGIEVALDGGARGGVVYLEVGPEVGLLPRSEVGLVLRGGLGYIF